MSFTATAIQVDDTLRHEVTVNGRHTIVTDEPASLGGGNRGPAPHELLPATLASCISTMIVLYARKKAWSLEGVMVHVDYDNAATPRRFDITISLPDTLTPEQTARLRRVAETCPVRRSMEAGFAFAEEVVTTPSSSGAAMRATAA